MTEHIKTPELRFPEFKDKWNQINLKEICDITSSKRIYAKDYVRRGIPFFRGKEISSNGFKHQEDLLYISEEIYNYFSEKYGSPKEGDLLITSVGTIGNVALVPSDFKFYFKDGNLIWLKDIKMNSHFLKYYLESFQGKKRLLDKASGSNQKALTISGLESLKVNTTNNNEEIKIKNFFNKLDRQIELEEQKLEKLEEQKKGYMQKIFSQELRFKDENGNDYPEWEDKLISDIGKVVTGNTPSKKDNDYWNSNQYVWVTPTDISNKKNIYTSGYQLSQKGFSKARQLPKNTLLITCIASIGKNAILRIEGSCNQQINAVIPNDNYDVDYLYYAFEDVSKLMKSIAGKTATQIVNKAVFEKLLLNVPIYEEQQKISGFLNKVDILIDKQTQKIDELKLRKQGFLQKMFV